jgi:heme/copper-type cytochrome/quinol oxidase subunit 3
MEATDAASAARVAAARVAKPNGWWGMVILIASEATLFGTFFGTYYYLRFHNAVWPPAGTPKPRVVVPLILVGVLAVTSLPMQLSWLAAKRARVRAAWSFLFLAFVVQCGYLAFEIHDLLDQLAKSRPQDNAYSSIYYVILGSDHAHVLAGLLFSLWFLVRLTGGLTNYRLSGLRSVVLYWHFVNLLTLLVIGCLLSADV